MMGEEPRREKAEINERKDREREREERNVRTGENRHEN